MTRPEVAHLADLRSSLSRAKIASLFATTLMMVVANELLASSFLDFDLQRFCKNAIFICTAVVGSVVILIALNTRLKELSLVRSTLLVYAVVCVVSITPQLIVVGVDSWQRSLDIVITSLLICAAIVALITRRYMVHVQLVKQEKAQSDARVQALQSRIRPHFLFNSMNSIASLIAIDPERAETAVEDLAELFRAALAETATLVKINDELNICRKYLDVESLRLGDRLTVDWQVDANLLDEMIPALSIQPLLENAIYHGIQPKVEGGTIWIKVKQHDGFLTICIENPSNDEVQSTHKGNRMAIANIQERLAQLYSGRASLVARVENNKYVAEIKVPIQEG